MRVVFPDFRLGSVLATSFTGTLSERHGAAVERIPTPQRLVDWLAVNGLAVDSCTSAQLDLARKLRESIHAAAAAAPLQVALPAPAVEIIKHPSASPAQVKSALQTSGTTDWNNVDDGDNIKEKLLNVGGY